MIKSKLLIGICIGLLASMPVVATENEDTGKNESNEIYTSDNTYERVNIKWIKPKSFTDVKNASFSSSKYRKHVFKQLEKHFDKLSQTLPLGQSLVINVTDLDLAGRVEPGGYSGFSGGLDDVRIMRTIDIPRIKFEYQLVDTAGKLIKSEQINLKDMNYLDTGYSVKRNRPFAYEKKMLSKWFKKNFEQSAS